MGRHGDTDRRVDARQLLDRDRVAEVVGAAASVLLRIGDAHETELAELAHDLVGEGLGPVELLGERLHLAEREVAHERPDGLLLSGEVEMHRRRIPNNRSKLE